MDRKKLLWMDLEMTGLEPSKDRIVEVACIVTDYDFNHIDSFEAAINVPDSEVDELFAANDWFAGSSQYEELRAHMRLGMNEEKVRKDLVAFIQKNFKTRKAILAGNSIHQDRRFIRAWWPEVDGLLHYRMLDVTSFKLLMENKYRFTVAKSEKHRALSDVQESIEELKTYLEKLGKKG